MQEIVPGLWRWTSPHPAWAPGAQPDSPGDWDELVGCVLYECDDAVVFVDPLLPRDSTSFWRWADRRVGRRRVHVVTTLSPHRRSREQVANRYGASTSRARRNLPAEVRPPVLQDGNEALRRCLASAGSSGRSGAGVAPCHHQAGDCA